MLTYICILFQLLHVINPINQSLQDTINHHSILISDQRKIGFKVPKPPFNKYIDP